MSTPAARSVLLVGGTSEIGLAIVRRLNRLSPVRPVLLGRDEERLRDALDALGLGGETGVLDAAAIDTHDDVIARAFASAGGFDVVVLAVGLLGAQAGLDASPREAAEVMRVNFEGCGSLLLQAMRALRGQGRPGTVVVLSSVAAERPRASNPIYGAAKAGLDSLAQGLADASASGAGPRVLVVRPGFVKTRMTAGLRPAPFATTADAVAGATVKALQGRATTIWVPGVLRYVFAVLRHLPRPLFRRLPL
jgi:decaprenylphospho-beta-D-erythro-pentofuranosid-2-ulose 2-reductase